MDTENDTEFHPIMSINLYLVLDAKTRLELDFTTEITSMKDRKKVVTLKSKFRLFRTNMNLSWKPLKEF